MSKEIEDYVRERNAVMLENNLQSFIKWAASHGVTYYSPQIADLSRRKIITACVGLPQALRDEAKQWLEARGYKSWD